MVERNGTSRAPTIVPIPFLRYFTDAASTTIVGNPVANEVFPLAVEEKLTKNGEAENLSFISAPQCPLDASRSSTALGEKPRAFSAHEVRHSTCDTHYTFTLLLACIAQHVLLTAETWVPFREISSDDVARAALLGSGAQMSISLLTEAFVPFAIMKSVMDETSRREKLKELVRLAERQADLNERFAQR